MWQNERSNEKELIDLGSNHYTQTEYDECLVMLGQINRYLGGFEATRKAFIKLDRSPKSILDVGCGGGSLCLKLHEWFPSAAIVGIDINQKAIEQAKKSLPADSNQKISFHHQPSNHLNYPNNSFECVTTLLVCHHMTEEELIFFLKESYRVCSKAVILNDLHRHLLAYLGFCFMAPIAFPNRLINHDGPLSVKRGFRKREWIDLVEKAGFEKNQYTLDWNWAFRWTLTLKKQ